MNWARGPADWEEWGALAQSKGAPASLPHGLPATIATNWKFVYCSQNPELGVKSSNLEILINNLKSFKTLFRPNNPSYDLI